MESAQAQQGLQTVGFVHSMGPKFGKGDGRRCIRGLGTMEHRLRAGSSGVRCGHARSLLAGGRLLPARMAWLGKVLTRRSRSGCPAVARLNTGWGKSENCRKFCGEIRHQAPKRKATSRTNPKNQSPVHDRFACVVSLSTALRSSGPCPGADPQRTSLSSNMMVAS